MCDCGADLNVEVLEECLAELPPKFLNDPEDDLEAAANVLFHILRGLGATPGPRGAVLGASGAVSIPQIVIALQEERWGDAARALVQWTGSISHAIALVVEIRIRLSHGGFLVGGGGIIRQILRRVPLLAAAVEVAIGVLEIPDDVNQTAWKMFFVSDMSGILTSWVYNDIRINPHWSLLSRARTGGYFGADVSDACMAAHRVADNVWRRCFRFDAENKRRLRDSASDWQGCWERLGCVICQQVEYALPTMYMVRSEIRAAESRVRTATPIRLANGG